jgi:hypothetical protein
MPYHIDCTYKLCERGFPLIVFGLSDLAGLFFPIAFAIVSHEQEGDFTLFFQTLLMLRQHMNIVPNINYLIQDACGASANAASKCLGPNIKILMCFFHVQKNVRERLKGCDEIVKTGIIKGINYLHFCRNNAAKHNIYNKWVANGLSDSKNYFDEQWVRNGKFNKWVNII